MITGSVFGDFDIIICTYKRPNLVNQLLQDLATQTILPERVIIIDGDPVSGEVKSVLENNHDFLFIYVPSNHANISYQRYLGWRTAKDLEPNVIVYLDDDLRINLPSSIEHLLSPFINYTKNQIGSTAVIKFQNKTPSISTSDDNQRLRYRIRKWIGFFSWSNNRLPGSLTPTGIRIKPEVYDDNGFGKVKWAYGGVMAFNTNFLHEECFLDDSFALHHIGYGLGEDTLISHIASLKGDIFLVPYAEFIHPNADSSKAYPSRPFRSGYATAYSRRLINDHYRENPQLSDRIYLLQSYLGNNIVNFIDFIVSINTHQLHFFAGYLIGSVRGVFQKPTAKTLTPNINWRMEAEAALNKTIIIE